MIKVFAYIGYELISLLLLTHIFLVFDQLDNLTVFRKNIMKTSNIALLIEKSINVIDSINKGVQLTPEEQQFFCDNFECQKIKKNEFAIQIGDFEKYLYFIESGILRYWTKEVGTDLDKEITFWFSFHGEFANSYFSLRQGQPSLINIQALTDCVIWKLEKTALTELYKTSLNINKIARIVLEDVLIRKISRETSILGYSCEKRYRDLIARDKELIQNIPLKYIASYIGVTPQRLSQIRKKI